MHNYHKMKIYERAIALAVQVYRLAARLPRNEEFGLRSQMRRAAVSVCLNIAEGSGASSNREFGRFLEIARRSLYEMNACFQICVRLELVQNEQCAGVVNELGELAAMITGFHKQLKR